MNDKLVYVIILAWNHKEDTHEVLSSILKDEYANKKIVVVDNASSDGTTEMIQNEFKDVNVIRSEKNLGVSGGYNLGIDYAISNNADFILVANNDISTDKGMISQLVLALEKDPLAGIAMPRIYHYYGDRTHLWCTGAHWRKFPPTVKMTNYNRPDWEMGSVPIPIDFAPSCVLLLRKQMIEEIGEFDTTYFFYFDDWDFSKRSTQAGYRILFVPEAKMWHKVSKSTQNSEKPAQWWHRMGFSAALYYSKYHSTYERFTFFLWFIIREVLKGKPNRSIGFLKGFLEFQKTGTTSSHSNQANSFDEN